MKKLCVIFLVTMMGFFSDVIFAAEIAPFTPETPRSSVGFFAPRFNHLGDPEQKSRKEIFPKGSLFLYAGYSGEIERDIANGFSVGGPFYSLQEKLFVECRDKGIPVFAHIGHREYGGLKNVDALEAAAKNLSEAAIRGMVREQIINLDAINPNIVAWAIVPEEVRPWKAKEIEYLKNVSTAIRVFDRQKRRPIFMYHPNNRTEEMLKPMVAYLDIIGRGNYVNVMGYTNDRAWLRYGVEECVKTIKNAEKKNKNQFATVNPWMAIDPENPEDDKLIPTWVRHDVYAGLIAGGQGVIIWSLFKHRPTITRTWQPYYEAYAQCGKELTQGNHLGDVFLFGVKRNDIKIKTVEERNEYVASERKVIDDVEAATTNEKEKRGGMTLFPWQSAEFAFSNMRFLFVVNSWHEPTTFQITNLPNNARIYNAFTNEHITDDKKIEKVFAPWEVMGLRIIGKE